jgi:hypothetical protein
MQHVTHHTLLDKAMCPDVGCSACLFMDEMTLESLDMLCLGVFNCGRLGRRQASARACCLRILNLRMMVALSFVASPAESAVMRNCLAAMP